MKESMRKKRETYTFGGELTTIKAFSEEMNLPVYLVSIMLKNSYSMDQICINKQVYEQDGTFIYWRTKYNEGRCEDKRRSEFTFGGSPTSIRKFCRFTGYPYKIVRIMLDEGMDMDEIYSQWEHLNDSGKMYIWLNKAKSYNKKKRSSEDSIDLTDLVEDKSCRLKAKETEKERIKRLMSIPVNPLKTYEYYFMKGYTHRPDNDYNMGFK